jgi:hypothetical protein
MGRPGARTLAAVLAASLSACGVKAPPRPPGEPAPPVQAAPPRAPGPAGPAPASPPGPGDGK